jgi:hypothetical protein
MFKNTLKANLIQNQLLFSLATVPAEGPGHRSQKQLSVCHIKLDLAQ